MWGYQFPNVFPSIDAWIELKRCDCIITELVGDAFTETGIVFLGSPNDNGLTQQRIDGGNRFAFCGGIE
eukprot:scaffold60416_cov81-Cyclotella_meneghiniana.AAC.1